MKKMMILVLAVAATASVQAQACSQFEAQFIGTVSKIEKKGQACTVRIDFSTFDSSIVCPLDISEVEGKDIATTQCDKKLNDSISGIVINSHGKLSIE